MSSPAFLLRDFGNDYLQRRVGMHEPLSACIDFPRYFEIETVNACNASCPMCTIADWNRNAGAMKDELFDKLAAEIGEHADVVRRVSLYRDGEPLLDKRLSRRVALLKSKGVKRVGISTNVSLLTEGRASTLLWAGIDEVILSIDSINRQIYKDIRVGLDFDMVMDNAQNFVRLRDSINPNCQIWVRMIRQQSNYREWDAYRRYWEKWLKKSDRIDYRDLHNWGGALNDYRQVKPQEVAMPCLALWSLMTIFADGKVPMCNVDYNNKYPLGSVATHSIADVWQSQEQAKRRELHMTGRRKELTPCTNCTVWTEKTEHGQAYEQVA